MASYKNPKGIVIRPTDTVVVLIDQNPKKGALNTVYWQAIIDAIAADHSTVAAIRDFARNDPRYAHVPVLAEIRHNVGRGYYRLVRDERFGDEPPARPPSQQPPPVIDTSKIDRSKLREFGEGLQSVYV